VITIFSPDGVSEVGVSSVAGVLEDSPAGAELVGLEESDGALELELEHPLIESAIRSSAKTRQLAFFIVNLLKIYIVSQKRFCCQKEEICFDRKRFCDNN
jgi:hypothetical protein